MAKNLTKYFLLGGLGFVLGGPIGAALAVVITSMMDSTKALPADGTAKEGTQAKTSTQKTQASDVKVSLLVLIACVMKVDGHVRKAELDLVKRFLVRNYGEQGALEALQILKGLLEQDIDPMAVTAQIKQNVNYSTRLELLHFLFDLANSDSDFAESELQMIERISAGLNISPADYRSLAALYNKKKDPNWAYEALEITPGATNDEVKKAYRRMAMKYHPDKVAGAGEEMHDKATEKFQGINEAYEHIKAQRGMA
ncbi:MAG: TerB family tellurite resistance protein [Paludibacteraceae bacterium]|nr:TerB family tellurite resistance protein [Paludibacteraceae bacterium]